MKSLTTHRVHLGAYTVRYQTMGHGDPLIFVHGLAGSSRWWTRNAPIFARYYTVFLVDLPGFGSMNRTREGFLLSRATTWLKQWMEAVGISRAHLVGHSMGGYICMSLAAHYPDLVDHLILISPAAKSQVKSIVGYVGPLLAGMRYMTPDFLLTLSYDALRAGPRTLFRATKDIISLDAQKDIMGVSAPTLLIWGEDDTLVPPSLGKFLRNEMKNARLVILKRAGHVSMFDQAAEFNALSLAFLRGEAIGD